MLYELVYDSMAVQRNLQGEELLRILQSSRKHNLEWGITGLLLYHHGEFVQLLEGEREAVRQLYYDVLCKDVRHTALTVAWEQAVHHRSFPDWSMGFAKPLDLDPARTQGLEGYLRDGVKGLDPCGPGSVGRQLLLSIYRQMDPVV
jgi:Sensors of blue-light using FAD